MRAKSDLRSAQQRTITRLYEEPAMLPKLSTEVLREALAYDVESGRLLWKHRPLHHFVSAAAQKMWNARFAGTRAGSTHKFGYVVLRVCRQHIKAHRAAWWIVHGREPLFIDHDNGQRGDNRLANIDDVTKYRNSRNQRRPSHNTSGVLGVSQERRNGRWRAYIKEGDRNVSLGYYATIEEATAARKAAERRLGFNPNHGREA